MNIIFIFFRPHLWIPLQSCDGSVTFAAELDDVAGRRSKGTQRELNIYLIPVMFFSRTLRPH